jgi:hypothetical protein
MNENKKKRRKKKEEKKELHTSAHLIGPELEIGVRELWPFRLCDFVSHLRQSLRMRRLQ